MSLRRNPRIQQQRSLTFDDVLRTNRGIMNDNYTEFEGMSVSEYTGNATRAIDERRGDIRRAVARTRNLDDLLEYEEGLERVRQARVFIEDLMEMMEDQPPGFTVQDMRNLFAEANIAEQQRLALRQGFYVENPDGNVMVAVPERAGSLPEPGAGSLPENQDPSRFGSL